MSLRQYEELVRFAERELELARAGQLDEVSELQERRTAHVALLPSYPPAEARTALERAAALQRETTVVLAMGARSAVDTLRKVDRGRVAARSYAPAGGAPQGTLDRSA
ncbi:MAG: hypothetical protein WD844_15600 [Thermoleophilaceae bacterium]